MQAEIGNWKVGEKIGEGGMGTVYLAHHKVLDIPAALKCLSPLLLRDPKFRERFLREARAQAQLRHPGIAQVMDFLEQGEDLSIIVEYLPGGTLAEVMEKQEGGSPPVATILAWTRKALTALDYAHQHGVIHRDIKPSNIMLDGQGLPKVVDFGVALVLDGRRLTTTGSLGTPHYMSPEQVRRPLEVDHRTDVYAMGVVLFELLTGRFPCDGDSDFDIRHAQVNLPPKPLREYRPELPKELEEIVSRALEKSPDDRYSGCGEFARAIEAYERGDKEEEKKEDTKKLPPPLPPPAVRGSRRWKVALVVVGLLGAAAALILGLALADSHQRADSLAEELAGTQEQLSELGELSDAKSWTSYLADNFDDNRSYWGPEPGELGKTNNSVASGIYHWEETFYKPALTRDWPVLHTPPDGSLYLSVEAKKLSGPEDSYYCLFFRTDGLRYYSFRISDAGYSLWLHNDGWTTLWNYSSAIRSNDFNRIAVIARGSSFHLYINDELVAQVSDETLTGGDVGIGVGSESTGSGSFEFDNFEVRTKAEG